MNDAQLRTAAWLLVSSWATTKMFPPEDSLGSKARYTALVEMYALMSNHSTFFVSTGVEWACTTSQVMGADQYGSHENKAMDLLVQALSSTLEPTPMKTRSQVFQAATLLVNSWASQRQDSHAEHPVTWIQHESHMRMFSTTSGIAPWLLRKYVTAACESAGLSCDPNVRPGDNQAAQKDEAVDNLMHYFDMLDGPSDMLDTAYIPISRKETP